MILLIASYKDVASLNIAREVLDHYSFEKTGDVFQETPTHEFHTGGKTVRFVTLNEESVYAQNLASCFNNLELAVFISRHSSVSGTPTLSVHTPGNLGEAELGGITNKVSISPANTMRDSLKTMMKFKEEMHLNYEVTYEGTHHGPSLDVPTMFVELGSSSKQWSDLKAAEAVAHAAMEGVVRFGTSVAKAVLGVGGPHYNGKFTRMALESDIAFGHMIPKYVIPFISQTTLKQCVERTLEKVESTVLDWKGIKGEDKMPLVEMLNKLGIPFEKV